MDHKPKFTKKLSQRIEHLMGVILATRFSDLDADEAACRELLELSTKAEYPYGLAYAYAYLGDCLIGKNESVAASNNLMRAKELCEKNRFLDLLPYVCTWLGIYYEMQNDRQMAMHCYLDALEFAERGGDLLRQSILLNNIASQFQNCGNYQVAKEYYVKAFNIYNQLSHADVSDPHYAQMTANIISVCCRTDGVEEAKYYFSLLQHSNQLVDNQNQLYLCELLISAAMGDVAATRKSVDELLIEMEKRPKNLHQFFETFLVVADSMIALEEGEYARKLLEVLNNLCREDEYGHRLKVQYVWMRYYKIFGEEEERNAAYREFYDLRQKSDDILNQNLADGLLSKIKLRESVQKNKEMEKAKEVLEGEAQLDELTGLYNRRSFRKLTEQVAADPQVRRLTFIMIDVDYFKQYNDTYGHAKGDDTLRAVARSMVDAADGDVYNFRYGGDEFASLCKNKSVEEVEAYITTLTENLHRQEIPHVGSLSSDKVTLSIGYSLQEKEGETVNIPRLITQADKALYWAKGRGRNCHFGYSEEMEAPEGQTCPLS